LAQHNYICTSCMHFLPNREREGIDTLPDAVMAWRPEVLTLSSVRLPTSEGADPLKLQDAVSQLVRESAFGEEMDGNGDAVEQSLILKGGLDVSTEGADELLASLSLLSELGPAPTLNKSE
jgi:hypothetical protein